MFTLIKDPMDTQAEKLQISSITVAVGDMLFLAAGSTTWALASATSQHWQRKAVAIEAATTADTEVKAVLINDYQLWEVELANASSTTHDGDRMILTDENTVNNTGTDNTSENALFVQRFAIGASADNRSAGHFVAGTGVDPDAA